jgi:hypothetical protein
MGPPSARQTHAARPRSSHWHTYPGCQPRPIARPQSYAAPLRVNAPGPLLSLSPSLHTDMWGPLTRALFLFLDHLTTNHCQNINQLDPVVEIPPWNLVASSWTLPHRYIVLSCTSSPIHLDHRIERATVDRKRERERRGSRRARWSHPPTYGAWGEVTEVRQRAKVTCEHSLGHISHRSPGNRSPERRSPPRTTILRG